MSTTLRTKKPGKRVSYSFAEFAAKAGRERTWVYRQVAKGRIRAITGFGAAMIPASEVERIFGGEIDDAIIPVKETIAEAAASTGEVGP